MKWEIRQTVDLACMSPQRVTPECLFAVGDAQAHRWLVTVRKAGAPMALTGWTATVLVQRPDGVTVPVEGGVDSDCAYADLSAACNSCAGHVLALFTLAKDNQVITVAEGRWRVGGVSSDKVVDPEGVIPSLSELLAAVADMRAATADARTAAETASAAADSSAARTDAAIADMQAEVGAALGDVRKELDAAQAETAAALADTAPGIECEASGALVTVSDAAARPAVQVVSDIVTVQSGTGDPTPDNVRPIIGWDAVTLTRAGKNLLGFGDYEDVLGAYTDSCVRGVFTRTVTVQHTTTSCLHANAMANIGNAHLKAGTYVFTLTCSSGIKFTSPYAEVTLNDGTNVQLKSGKATTLAMDGTITGIKQTLTRYQAGDVITFTMQLEADEVATDYEPYQGQTLTASLPETIYGGSLDWTTGVLTVNHFIQTLDGTEAWAAGSSGMVYSFDNRAVQNVRVMTDNNTSYHLCSHYKPAPYKSPADQADMTCYTLNSYQLAIKDTQAGTLDNFKAYLSAQAAAGTPVTLLWRLKPAYYTTVQLTPQQLDMLKGSNAVWSDSGDTSLVYIADTKMYIDNAIAALAAAQLNA